MQSMNNKDRKIEILKTIIQYYTEKSTPISSSYIQKKISLKASSATIRNEMKSLEEEGLLSSVHVSSGKIPTEKWYRFFIDEMMEDEFLREEIIKEQQIIHQEVLEKEIEDRLNFIVNFLAKNSSNVGFATIPHKEKAYFLGLSNIFKKPEFNDMQKAHTVIEILEDQKSFTTFLNNLKVGSDIEVFIGKENLIEQINSCSLVITRYNFYDHDVSGFLGILWPIRMNYARNIALLDYIKKKTEIKLLGM